MIDTFNTLAEVTKEENKIEEMTENNSTVDMTSIINRLNALQNAVDDLTRRFANEQSEEQEEQEEEIPINGKEEGVENNDSKSD